jgi:cysteinyl-tRNA synthetase
MCLNTSYRKQLLFSFDALKQAEDAYKKLKNKALNLPKEGELDKAAFDKYNDKFKEELSNDLNTPNALAVLYELLKDNEVNGTTKRELIDSFDKVFSLDLLKEEEKTSNEDDAWILELIEKRKEAKANKDYALADQIRNELLEKGVELLDTREGTTYKIK